MRRSTRANGAKADPLLELARRPSTARKSLGNDELTRAVPSRLSVQENGVRMVAANRSRNMLIAAVETGQHEGEAGSRRRRAATGGPPEPDFRRSRTHSPPTATPESASRARPASRWRSEGGSSSGFFRLARPQSAAGSRFRGDHHIRRGLPLRRLCYASPANVPAGGANARPHRHDRTIIGQALDHSTKPGQLQTSPGCAAPSVDLWRPRTRGRYGAGGAATRSAWISDTGTG